MSVRIPLGAFLGFPVDRIGQATQPLGRGAAGLPSWGLWVLPPRTLSAGSIARSGVLDVVEEGGLRLAESEVLVAEAAAKNGLRWLGPP